MTERLLIPSWNAPSRSLMDWKARLEELGHRPEVERKDSEDTWLVLEPIGLRLLAVLEGVTLIALHAEIDREDPGPAVALLEDAANGLSWEVHDEEDDEDD